MSYITDNRLIEGLEYGHHTYDLIHVNGSQIHRHIDMGTSFDLEMFRQYFHTDVHLHIDGIAAYNFRTMEPFEGYFDDPVHIVDLPPGVVQVDNGRYFREFGQGRADDFPTPIPVSLDDGGQAIWDPNSGLIWGSTTTKEKKSDCNCGKDEFKLPIPHTPGCPKKNEKKVA